jgi:hypothetical protein
MRRGLVVLAVLAGVAITASAAAGGGNSDAAHACQQGGYLNLQRSDGSSFTNAGDCVSYFAQGGTLPSCTVTATSGCLVLDHVVMPGVPNPFGFPNPGWTVTVNAAFSFDTSCNYFDPNSTCGLPSLPNGYATGGGTYVIKDATGTVVEQGTLRTANIAGTSEGLAVAEYGLSSDPSTPVSCPTAPLRVVAVFASTNAPGDPSVALELATNSANPGQDAAVFLTNTDEFLASPFAGGTLTC